MAQTESKQPDTKVMEEEARARRDFLKRAAAVGVAAPAVMLLLSVKPAQALENGNNYISPLPDVN